MRVMIWHRAVALLPASVRSESARMQISAIVARTVRFQLVASGDGSARHQNALKCLEQYLCRGLPELIYFWIYNV